MNKKEIIKKVVSSVAKKASSNVSWYGNYEPQKPASLSRKNVK